MGTKRELNTIFEKGEKKAGQWIKRPVMNRQERRAVKKAARVKKGVESYDGGCVCFPGSEPPTSFNTPAKGKTI